MSDRQNIEELFRSKLGDAELTPSKGAWKGVQRKMRMRQFLRFDPGRFNIYYLAAILIAGLTAASLLNRPPAAPVENEQGESVVFEEQQEHKSTVEVKEEKRNDTGIRAERNENKTSSAGADEQVQEDVAKERETEQPLEGELAEAAPMAEEMTDDRGEQETPEASPTLVAWFTASTLEGCAPLKVKFNNSSVNATSVLWSFGHGEHSNEFSPVYQYEEPGIYAVAMNITGADGSTGVHRQVIRVHPAPVAGFEMGEGLEGADGSISMELMNYSTGAYSYSWDFLSTKGEKEQGWSSNEFQPIVTNHEIPGDARLIRMVVQNEQGCTDTVISELKSMNGVERTMLFPTVFRANNTGPTGGHYSQHEMRRDIFHPRYSEEPAKYQLRIYSKMGELVFETRDINQGWDGYYQQERSAGGVYMWVAEGNWQNGTSFNQRGDVTLLWNEWR